MSNGSRWQRLEIFESKLDNYLYSVYTNRCGTEYIEKELIMLEAAKYLLNGIREKDTIKTL